MRTNSLSRPLVARFTKLRSCTEREGEETIFCKLGVLVIWVIFQGDMRARSKLVATAFLLQRTFKLQLRVRHTAYCLWKEERGKQQLINQQRAMKCKCDDRLCKMAYPAGQEWMRKAATSASFSFRGRQSSAFTNLFKNSTDKGLGASPAPPR